MDLPQPTLQPLEGRGAHICYVGWSPKLGRSVCFGSRLEFLHWLLLEGTPEVAHFCEYYPSVPLESRKFVFDMWLRWSDGREECRMVVTNWSHLGAGPLLSFPDWSVLVCWARDRGYRCELVTEREISVSMKRINNWRRMLHFVKYALDNPDPALERAVLERLRGSQDLPMRELTPLHDGAGDTEVTAVVAKLLHSGKLKADLDRQHFGPNLMLRLAA